MKARPRGTDASLLGSLPWTLFALGVSDIAPHTLPYLPHLDHRGYRGCAVPGVS